VFNVLLYAFEMWTIKYRDKELLKAFKMKYYRRLFSGAGKLTYCAFFDKSTNFGTEVDQYIMNKFGGGATAELPPGGRGGHFPKWPPADIQPTPKSKYKVSC